jgi:hypothetical protein
VNTPPPNTLYQSNKERESREDNDGVILFSSFQAANRSDWVDACVFSLSTNEEEEKE